jgi:hypothetical protein
MKLVLHAARWVISRANLPPTIVLQAHEEGVGVLTITEAGFHLARCVPASLGWNDAFYYSSFHPSEARDGTQLGHRAGNSNRDCCQ